MFVRDLLIRQLTATNTKRSIQCSLVLVILFDVYVCQCPRRTNKRTRRVLISCSSILSVCSSCCLHCRCYSIGTLPSWIRVTCETVTLHRIACSSTRSRTHWSSYRDMCSYVLIAQDIHEKTQDVDSSYHRLRRSVEYVTRGVLCLYRTFNVRRRWWYFILMFLSVVVSNVP
jgi:hypothetical protein